EILTPLTDTDLESLRPFAAYERTVADHPVLLARTGYTGEDGFEMFIKPADKAPAIWEALTAEGSRSGLLPAGLAARDTPRVEAEAAFSPLVSRPASPLAWKPSCFSTPRNSPRN